MLTDFFEVNSTRFLLTFSTFVLVAVYVSVNYVSTECAFTNRVSVSIEGYSSDYHVVEGTRLDNNIRLEDVRFITGGMLPTTSHAVPYCDLPQCYWTSPLRDEPDSLI